MSNKKQHARGAWSRYVDSPDNFGFFKFNNASVNTLTEHDYERIIDDEEKWADLRKRMDADFHDALDMFPFEKEDSGAENPDSNWIENTATWFGSFLKGFALGTGLTHLDLPKRYFAISKALFEKRFPGGRVTGEPGDGDLRDMISDFRILFKKNFAHYILQKRLYQLGSVAAFAIAVMIILCCQGSLIISMANGLTYLTYLGINANPLLLPGADTATLLSDGVVLAVFTLAYWLVFLFYKMLSDNTYYAYKNAQTESCKTLDKQAALRTKNLSNLISTLIPRIDKDQAELIAASRAKDWPERSRKWVLLVYWLGKRQESLEYYTQLEMWLVRRSHYYYRIVGSLANWATIFISLLVLVLLPVLTAGFTNFHITLNELQWSPDVLNLYFSKFQWSNSYIIGSVGVLFGIAMVLHLASLTNKRWNTSLDLIQENIDIKNWDRFENVRLPERLADQVFRDKQYLLQREDWVAGKNR